MRAGLAQGLAVLLLWVVLVVLVEAPPPLPQPASHQHAVNLVTDFVSTYMPGSRMLTVVGDAPWLSALLRTASALVSMPAVRLLAEDDDDKDKDDDDAGDKYNYDPGHGPPRFVGWLAAHILVIVDRPTTDAVSRAIRLLAPPAQYDPILVIMFSVTTMSKLRDKTVADLLLTAVLEGHWRVVILDPSGAVLGFVPFGSGCFTIRPQRLATWRQGQGFSPTGPLFTDLKRITFAGCPLIASYFAAPPTVKVLRHNGTVRIGGFTGYVMDAMAAVLNTSFLVHEGIQSSARYRGVTVPGQLGETIVGKSDVTVGPITGLAERNVVVEWSNMPLTECYTWFVPYAVGTAEQHALYGVVTSFTWAVWVQLATVAALTAAIIVLVVGPGRGVTMGKASRAVAAVLLTQPTILRLPATFTAARLVYGAWLLTGLVLTAAYQAKLWSIMSREDRVGLRTLQELVDTGLQVQMPSIVYPDLVDSARSNITLRTLLDRTSPMTSFASILKFGFKRTNKIFLLDESMGVYLASLTHSDGEEPPVYRLPGCFTRYPSNYFAVKRGSPLLGRLDSVWKRLYHAGILQHLLQELKDNSSLVKAATAAKRSRRARGLGLSLHDLRGCFEVLANGLAVSLAAFLGEHVAANFVPLRACARRLRKAGARLARPTKWRQRDQHATGRT